MTRFRASPGPDGDRSGKRWLVLVIAGVVAALLTWMGYALIAEQTPDWCPRVICVD